MYYNESMNLQGDVVMLLDASGNTVAEYSYDAWGKVLSESGTLASTNPLRYRGYYYDKETKLYYLQSRYYDPQIGRFINADGLASTGQGILGCNMFAYCGNEPVGGSDPSGDTQVDGLRVWAGHDGEAGLYYVPWEPDYDYEYAFPDFLLDVFGGPIDFDYSYVVGFCLMFEFSASLIIDENGTVALLFSPGIGGGFGKSSGGGWTEYPYNGVDIHGLSGSSVKIGGSIFFLSVEVDDSMGRSIAFSKPRKGAEFHATINRTWVVILRERKYKSSDTN